MWFWEKGRFSVYRLSGRKYARRERSKAMPALDLDELAKLVTSTDASHQTEAARAYRKTLRRRG